MLKVSRRQPIVGTAILVAIRPLSSSSSSPSSSMQSLARFVRNAPRQSDTTIHACSKIQSRYFSRFKSFNQLPSVLADSSSLKHLPQQQQQQQQPHQRSSISTTPLPSASLLTQQLDTSALCAKVRATVIPTNHHVYYGPRRLKTMAAAGKNEFKKANQQQGGGGKEPSDLLLKLSASTPLSVRQRKLAAEPPKLLPKFVRKKKVSRKGTILDPPRHSLVYSNQPEERKLLFSKGPLPGLPAEKKINDMKELPSRFITYYFLVHNIPLPNVIIRRHVPMRLKKTPETRPMRLKHRGETWSACFTVPDHVNIEGKKVKGFTASLINQKKNAAYMKTLIEAVVRLLNVSPMTLVDHYRKVTKPFRDSLESLLESPIEIAINSEQIQEGKKIIHQISQTTPFKVPKPKSLPAQPPLASFPYSLQKPTPPPVINLSEIKPPATLPTASKNLPMYAYYTQIMHAINQNPVVIIAAETGAGKTTQLPQFLLAFHQQFNKGKGVNVIITQPRRIAAISVAARVADERGEKLGKGRCAVGYQVRFEEVRPRGDARDGHVVFCTSGILLRRLQDDPDLRGVTHIILDEVHERDMNTDLLLITVRNLLRRRTDLKVILMSATANTALFASYFQDLLSTSSPQPSFGLTKQEKNQVVPVVSVPGRLYPVREYHLEDVMEIIQRSPALRHSSLCDETRYYLKDEMGHHRERSHGKAVVGGPRRSHPGLSHHSSHAPPRGFPYDLFEGILAHICKTKPEGAILVFLPGWTEIQTLLNLLKETDTHRVGYSSPSFQVFALHSSVPMHAQQSVFERPPKGVRKIILATNIAETSVTINDVGYVVDSGQLRVNSYDPNSKVSSLNAVWAARSNIKQRVGRAGRCQPGEYYTILTSTRRSELPYNVAPELLRVDLQSAALKIKALNLAPSLAEVLSQAPEPPRSSAIREALKELTDLGALDQHEQLTPLGKMLADMPVDPWMGRMVLLAAVLGCLDPILTIVGAMSGNGKGVHSIYAFPPEEKATARKELASKFGKGTESDHVMMLRAFDAWAEKKREGGVWAAKDFARENYLHHTGLMNVEKSKVQLLRVLKDYGIVKEVDEEVEKVAAQAPLQVSTLEDPADEWEEVGVELGTQEAEIVKPTTTPRPPYIGGNEANVHSSNMKVVRAVLTAALYPNVAELCDKDEYFNPTDRKMGIVTSTVNCWQSHTTINKFANINLSELLSGSSNRIPEHEVQDIKALSQAEIGEGLIMGLSDERFEDAGGPVQLKKVNNTPVVSLKDLEKNLEEVVLPPRFICFQEKQRLDRRVILRSTTRADPMALVLFASGSKTQWRPLNFNKPAVRWSDNDSSFSTSLPAVFSKIVPSSASSLPNGGPHLLPATPQYSVVLDDWIPIKISGILATKPQKPQTKSFDLSKLKQEAENLLESLRPALKDYVNWVVWVRAEQKRQAKEGRRVVLEQRENEKVDKKMEKWNEILGEDDGKTAKGFGQSKDYSEQESLGRRLVNHVVSLF
ncbi:ATP-dependent DNA/RNA helicase dhx36 [Chytridiales sp. JEL 0842]|nr:ATP-dependent DNA/RNA helicase dhx36 [Chytridiales sp. JEL 0842]